MGKGFPTEVVYCQKQYDDPGYDYSIIILNKSCAERFNPKLCDDKLLSRDDWKGYLQLEHGYEHFLTYPFTSGMNQLGFRKRKVLKKNFIIK